MTTRATASAAAKRGGALGTGPASRLVPASAGAPAVFGEDRRREAGMRISNAIAVRPLQPLGDIDLLESELLIDGRASGTLLSGVVLEAAVELGDGFLLFLTDDLPSEDRLSIHRIGRDGRVLDSVRIGAMRETGSFGGLVLHEPDRVGFRFVGDTAWTVELFRATRFAMPFGSEPRGVKRGLRFHRRFRVHGEPSRA